MNFQDKLKEKTGRAEEVIKKYLPKEEGFAKNMAQAMNYSMLAGGKRLRPLLMEETYRLFGGEETVIEPFMAGMEMIHTHSLIHDDLPAIDNDDYRRGRLTTHKVYGEAMGVLSGAALLNYAYEVMLQAFALTEEKERVIKALTLMANKTGIYGMLGGQSVDVENDGKPLTKEMLDYIYMAFQIQDDILDVTSTEEELGKPVHSDEKNNKVTYVSLFGIQEASEQVKRLSEEAVSLIRGLYQKNEFLCTLIQELVSRRK